MALTSAVVPASRLRVSVSLPCLRLSASCFFNSTTAHVKLHSGEMNKESADRAEHQGFEYWPVSRARVSAEGLRLSDNDRASVCATRSEEELVSTRAGQIQAIVLGHRPSATFCRGLENEPATTEHRDMPAPWQRFLLLRAFQARLAIRALSVATPKRACVPASLPQGPTLSASSRRRTPADTWKAVFHVSVNHPAQSGQQEPEV